MMSLKGDNRGLPGGRLLATSAVKGLFIAAITRTTGLFEYVWSAAMIRGGAASV